MSEPSGDAPNPPVDPSPASPSAPPPQNNVTRAPRANPPSVFNQKDAPPAPPPGTPPGFAEFMTWMQSMGNAAPTEEDARAAGRALIPKEQKKFSRRSAEATPGSPPTAGTEPAPSAKEAEPGQPAARGPVPEKGNEPPRLPTAELVAGERKRRSKDTPSRVTPTAVLLALLALVLIIGSFFLGRSTVPPANGAPSAGPGAAGSVGSDTPPGVLPAALQAKLEAALEAENSADFKRAEGLLAEVVQGGGHVHGLTLHQAQLAFFEGEFPRVLPLLNQSIAQGEEVAACYNLRGVLSNRTGGPARGIADLELAAQLDPFDARFAFYIGEAFRRMGKPQAAAGYLQQALLRLREPLLEDFYTLKLRLALLDLGREREFADELTANLAMNPPSIDALFAAAAQELHRNNLPAAVPYLDRAQSLATPEQMSQRLRDYYFFGFSDRKELARFFEPIKAAVAQAKATPVPTASPALNLSTGSAPTDGPGGSPAPLVPLEVPKIP